MDLFELDDLREQRERAQQAYLEFIRVPALSAGLYVLPAGGFDPQQPHRQDEVYFVVRGRGRIQVGADDQEVKAGTTVYVPAQVDHRFHSITEQLEILVIFAPAEDPHI